MRRFVLLVLFVITLANIYMAVSLYTATGWQGVWWIAIAVYLLQLSMPLLRFQGDKWREAWPPLGPALWGWGVLSMMAIGGASMVFFFTAVRDVVLFAARFVIPTEQFDLASAFSVQLEFGLIGVLFSIGVYQALRGPGIDKVEVPIKDLPKDFDGFRIVQISDLHIGPTIGMSYVRGVVRAVNELQADMIALTGDITDGNPAELGVVAQELGKMNSAFGRFFVTGNHEYYHHAPAWIRVHQESGTHVLTNENRILEKAGSRLAVLGVPDVTAHNFVREHVSDPLRAANGVPEGVTKILLAHQPISYKAAHAAGVHLQLSGHTHSGQFFPWNMVIGFFHDYYRGLNRFKDMWIYVNRGTGYWGPPLRTAVGSEITLLTLRQADLET